MGQIKVSARGDVVGNPDTTVVKISLDGKAKTVEEASEILLGTVAKVKDAVISVGIDKDSITSKRFILRQDFTRRTRKLQYIDQEEVVPDGMRYGQDLEFSFPKNNEMLAELMKRIKGISPMIGITFHFECSNGEELLDKALAMATAKALRKAQTIADASGCTLGKCLGNPNGATRDDPSSLHRSYSQSEFSLYDDSWDSLDADMNPKPVTFQQTVELIWEIE